MCVCVCILVTFLLRRDRGLTLWVYLVLLIWTQVCTAVFHLPSSRTDMTYAADWAVKKKSLLPSFLVFLSFIINFFSLFRPLFVSSFFLIRPRSGETRTQKLKSHLMRTQSLKVLSSKPAVGQYTAMHATLTARDFFLAISTLPVHSPAFFSKTSPEFFLCYLWLTPVPV